MTPKTPVSRLVSRRQTLRGLAIVGVSGGLGLPTSAISSPINGDATALYRAGRWQEAADRAAPLRDPDNLAFAARSLLAGAVLGANNAARANAVSQARRYSEAALAAFPGHIEARLQLATALGLQARATSPARAFARGMPQKVRRLVDSVSRDSPVRPGLLLYWAVGI